MPRDAQTSEVLGESDTDYPVIYTSSKISHFLCEFHLENRNYAPVIFVIFVGLVYNEV